MLVCGLVSGPAFFGAPLVFLAAWLAHRYAPSALRVFAVPGDLALGALAVFWSMWQGGAALGVTAATAWAPAVLLGVGAYLLVSSATRRWVAPAVGAAVAQAWTAWAAGSAAHAAARRVEQDAFFAELERERAAREAQQVAQYAAERAAATAALSEGSPDPIAGVLGATGRRDGA